MALLRKKMPTLIFEIPERKKLQGSSTEQSARSAHFFLDFKNTVTPISISNFLSEKLVPAPGPAGAPVIYRHNLYRVWCYRWSESGIKFFRAARLCFRLNIRK